jgi:serine/threonine protein phosphatase PrpC
MRSPVEAVGVLRAAGSSDPGRLREVNEDRFHVDVGRGLFVVIDGVGGQAAGGKAADTAVTMLRARLERETGPRVSRLREAITVANNEIHRLAGTRAEWNGMACVLTAVMVRGSRAIVGHVGDTRLYKLWRGRIEKITRDHSPVGEREDARELSEREAMQHPRRNEVYRDVGSEPHEPADPEFIDIQEVGFEPDAALLLCSDGLTDLVDSSTINEIVRRWAGRPQMVADALIEAANAAGGKDNVTVVYVEAEQFATAGELPGSSSEITRRLTPAAPPRPRRRIVRVANVVLIAVVIVLTFVRSDNYLTSGGLPDDVQAAFSTTGDRIVVESGDSITEALRRAQPGTTVFVEPGQYRETVILKTGVHLVSRVAGEATIRLPGNAPERAAAIVANGTEDASVAGFRIVGDSATPLGTGIEALGAGLTILDVEISGASRAAIDVGRGAKVRIAAGDINNNPGSALLVRRGGSATVTHSVFARNGTADGQKTLAIETGGAAEFTANVFVGTGPAVFTGSSEDRAAFLRDNWFVDPRSAVTARPGRGR